MSKEFLGKNIKKVSSKNLFSDLRGGGQRSRPLPLPPLTSTLPLLVSLFLSRSSGRFARARNSPIFPSPFSFYIIFFPLSYLAPFTSPHTPSSALPLTLTYLLTYCPPSHIRDELENVKRIMSDERTPTNRRQMKRILIMKKKHYERHKIKLVLRKKNPL